MRLLALVLSVLLVPHAVRAQAPKPPSGEFQLAGIEAKGIKRLSPEDVAKLAGVEIGKPVRVDLLQAVAEKLAASGVFTSVEYAYRTTAGRLTLTLNVTEADWTIPVVFDNFVWLTDQQLTETVREAFPTFDGAVPQNEHVPDRIVGVLQQRLRSKALPGTVAFMPHTGLKAGSLQFVFKVVDPSPVTCHVSLAGVSPEPHREMQTAIAGLVGQPYSRTYLTGLVNATLVDTYRRLGFWGAKFVSPATSTEGACPGVSVTLAAEEGAPYAWQSAEWRGLAAIDQAALDKLLGMKAGEIADLTRINAGLREVTRAYGRIGHVQASTRISPRLDEAAKRAVFEIDVNEGRQFRMGSLEVVGFSEADAAAIAKRWRLAAGDVYNTALVDEFLSKDLSAYRRSGLKPPLLQTRTDSDGSVVNVRVVQER